MGAHGMDPKGGFTTPNVHESETNRAVIAKTRKFVVVADQTKWGEVGFSTFAGLHEADLLVTNTGLSRSALRELRASVKELAVVET